MGPAGFVTDSPISGIVEEGVVSQCRLHAVVNAGAYRSAEEALDAALTVVEKAAAHDFDGTQDELEGLIMEGVSSKELSEEEFWRSVDAQTDAWSESFTASG